MYLNQVLKSLGKKCPKVEFNGISYDSRNVKIKDNIPNRNTIFFVEFQKPIFESFQFYSFLKVLHWRIELATF